MQFLTSLINFTESSGERMELFLVTLLPQLLSYEAYHSLACVQEWKHHEHRSEAQ